VFLKRSVGKELKRLEVRTKKSKKESLLRKTIIYG
jgi:hypothetical protein